MRVLCAGMILCALIGGAYAGERAVQLIKSFQLMCLLEPLNFARSEQKATVMHLPVRQDLRSPPDASGYFSPAKSWLLPLDSGPHEFTVAEAHGPKADVKTCGITAPDVDAADFRAELIKSMKLGKPAAQTTSSDGQYRNTVWAIGDRSLMLSDGSPINLKQGIQLLVSDKPPAR